MSVINTKHKEHLQNKQN